MEQTNFEQLQKMPYVSPAVEVIDIIEETMQGPTGPIVPSGGHYEHNPNDPIDADDGQSNSTFWDDDFLDAALDWEI